MARGVFSTSNYFVNATGLITRVATGSTLITATITAKNTIKTTINVVSA